MKISKSFLSTLGLVMITIWSAVQYLFYSNVPEDISTFAFLFLTNMCGCIILGVTQFKHMKKITKKTVIKALGLSFILLAMNFFMILGSRNMDSVKISSVMSLYVIFVAPLLLLLRKKVSFRSLVATIISIIALLLVFDADIEGIFSSINVIYLVIADLFFAAYVVYVSIATGDEDPQAIAMVQMAICAVLSLFIWIAEVVIFKQGSLYLDVEPKFWVSVLYIGIFIRALYSVIQFAAQKNVPPINASLIFASEVVITLILNPVLCKFFGADVKHASVFQIIGCILFVVSVLICDDEFMKKFNYNDMDSTTVVDQNGNEFQQVSLSRKIVNMNLLIGLGALVFSTVICLLSIYSIRGTVIDTSQDFGKNASVSSENALIKQVKNELIQKVDDKSSVATETFAAYEATAKYVSDTASEFLSNPTAYPKKFVDFPYKENADKWVMQMVVQNESIANEDIAEQNEALGNMETLFHSIHKENANVTTMYVGTEEGLLISYDPTSGVAEVSGAPMYYDFKQAEWYSKPKSSGMTGFTDTYEDSMGRGLTITCFAPIYNKAGKFIGAVGIDILQQDLNKKLVENGIVAPEMAVLVSSDGTVIASTNKSSEKNIENIKDEKFNLPLYSIANVILGSENGLKESEGHYVAFDTISATNWKLCIINPVEEIIAPAIKIRNNIDESTAMISHTVSDGIRIIIACCLIFFAVIVLLITYFVGKIAEKITAPLKHLEADVAEISKGNFDQRTTVNTQDEIGSLARAFNGMTSNLQNYITQLTESTAREERISSELNIATEIQADALPSDYPAFPDRKEFDLFFTMHPAKEVGGDFYDFFMIDESHLGIVIADVSGKGVPAALFMMISKTLIKTRALLGGSPSEILAFANNQLCENNKMEMFVTSWLGILDLKTGILTAANAGHEYPAIKHKDGKFELFKDPHGLVLAGIEGSRYRDYTLEFKSGDIIFVYTDGVAEATDANNELFGTDRMIDALNASSSDDCKDIINSVMAGIESFVGEAPQFDDITMVCMRLDKFME